MITPLDSIVNFILILMFSLTPYPGQTYEDVLKPENYPYVYVIPQNELAMATCGCPCGIGGMYAGVHDIEGIHGHAIIMAGMTDEKISDDWSQYSPAWLWASTLYHEIYHSKQGIAGDWDFMSYMTKDEKIQYDHELENDTYLAQNKFNAFMGLPQVNLDQANTFSVAAASGESTCYSNYKPLPQKDRPNLYDLIVFYDDGLIKHYLKKQH